MGGKTEGNVIQQSAFQNHFHHCHGSEIQNITLTLLVQCSSIFLCKLKLFSQFITILQLSCFTQQANKDPRNRSGCQATQAGELRNYKQL